MKCSTGAKPPRHSTPTSIGSVVELQFMLTFGQEYCSLRPAELILTPTGSGGVARRRSCVGKLSFYQGEEIVQEIE